MPASPSIAASSERANQDCSYTCIYALDKLGYGAKEYYQPGVAGRGVSLISREQSAAEPVVHARSVCWPLLRALRPGRSRQHHL